MRRVAIVLPPDIIAQLGIEQAMEDVEATFITRYFNNILEATAWLTNSEIQAVGASH